MKPSRFITLALAIISFGAVASPIEAKLAVQDAVAQVSPEQPQSLPIENIDGSKVSAKTQNAGVKLIEAYRTAQAANDTAGMVSAYESLKALYKTDSKNLSVATWLAYLHMTYGQRADAVAILETLRGKSSRQDVNIVNLRNLVANYYLAQDYLNAISCLTELDQLSPNEPGTVSQLGSAKVLSQDYAGAIPVLERAVRLIGDDPDTVRAVKIDLAVSYSRTNQENKAMEIFDSMRGDTGLRPNELAWMGYVYLKNRRLDDAIATLTKADEGGSDDPSVANNLASAYMERGKDGDRANAKIYFEKVYNSPAPKATAAYNLGTIHLAEQDYASAARYLKESADESNDPFAWNNLGRAYEGLNRISDAASAYQRASDLRPQVDVFATNAASAFQRSGDRGKAITYMERARANGNKDAQLALNLANAYILSGRHADGKKVLTESGMEAALGGSKTYWFNLGVANGHLKMPAEAEACYKKALDIDPTDLDSTNNLGMVYWDMGRYEDALVLFDKLQGLNPSSLDAKLNVAACHIRLGQRKEAIEIWKEVIRANPNRHDIRLDLADALWNDGDFPGARYHYAQVHQIDAKNARA